MLGKCAGARELVQNLAYINAGGYKHLEYMQENNNKQTLQQPTSVNTEKPLQYPLLKLWFKGY